MELAPGGIAKEINASDVDRFLATIEPATPVEQIRYDLAVELLDDIRRLDAQLKDSHRRIRQAVLASRTSVTEIYGIGPIIAAMVIGFSGDIARFANRDAYAAYNGTAPVEFSSAGRTVHRVSQRGNRQLNHALHMAAICQIRQRHSEGRRYFERRVAEGKTKKEALRALKRQVSNRVYRHLLADAARERAREDKRERLHGPARSAHIPAPTLRPRSLPDPHPRYDPRRRRAPQTRPGPLRT